jgi:hypothetical protein
MNGSQEHGAAMIEPVGLERERTKGIRRIVVVIQHAIRPPDTFEKLAIRSTSGVTLPLTELVATPRIRHL